MAIDKSLRQNYQIGKKVDAFKEGFKNIAGKASDAVTSGFAPDETTKEQKTLGSMVKSQAKSYATNKLTGVALGKLGLGSLVPYVGILSFLASKLGYKPSDLITGYTSGFMPGQTQAQYEAARGERQKQARIDNMLARRAAGKDYSQQNLNELTLGSRPGFYDNVPTYDLGMYQGIKTKVPKTPTVITPHEPDEVVSDITKDFSFEDKKGGPKGDIDVTKDFSFEDKKGGPTGPNGPGKGPGKGPGTGPSDGGFGGESGRRGGNGGGQGGNGGGQGGKGGRDGPSGRKAYGGLIGKPLPGRSRYL